MQLLTGWLLISREYRSKKSIPGTSEIKKVMPWKENDSAVVHRLVMSFQLVAL